MVPHQNPTILTSICYWIENKTVFVHVQWRPSWKIAAILNLLVQWRPSWKMSAILIFGRPTGFMNTTVPKGSEMDYSTQDHSNRTTICNSIGKQTILLLEWQPSWKKAAILNFRLANELIETTVPKEWEIYKALIPHTDHSNRAIICIFIRKKQKTAILKNGRHLELRMAYGFYEISSPQTVRNIIFNIKTYKQDGYLLLCREKISIRSCSVAFSRWPRSWIFG